MIGLLFALFGLLLSPIAIMAGLLGLLTFIAMPFASRRAADLTLALAMRSLERGGIVVTEAGELLLKRLSFTDQGLYKATFADGAKVFEDPAGAARRFKGGVLALLDEQHGVAFDPRHAAVARRKREAEETEDMYFRATDTENSTYGVRGWVRGVFALERDAYELPVLTEVRSIITGRERAEHPARVEQLYKFSRAPYHSKAALLRFFVPVIAFLGTLGGLWIIGEQMGGTDRSISFGLLALLLSTSGVDIDIRRLAKVAAGGLVPAAIVAALAVVLGPLAAGLAVVTFLLGVATLPVLTLLFRFSSRIAGFLGSLWFRIGLQGYDRPVFVRTADRYELREFAELEDVGSATWYDLLGQTVGFTFTPGKAGFDDAWSADEVDAHSEAATDGGPSTNLPPGSVRSEDLRRDVYGGFVPAKPDEESVYVKTGRFLRQLAPAATGQKSQRQLESAREKHGLQFAAKMSDKMIAYMAFAGMLFAIIVGVPTFIL